MSTACRPQHIASLKNIHDLFLFRATLADVMMRCFESNNSDSPSEVPKHDQVPRESCDQPVSGIRCHICSKLMKSGRQLELHVNAVHRKKKDFVCSECGTSFGWKNLLTEHQRKAHSIGGPVEEVACSECGRRLKTKRGLLEHLWSSHRVALQVTRLKKCRFCEKSFTTMQKLTEHERRHTGDRPYPCELCDYASNTRGNLTHHMKRKHKILKPRTCVSDRDNRPSFGECSNGG